MKAAFRIIFCFLITLNGISSQSPPHLVAKEASRQQIVRPNTSTTLECPVRNNKNVIFEWYKDNDAIMPYGSRRIRILGNGALRIKDTMYGDTGEYKCRAVNGFGSVEFKTILLVIGNEEDYAEYETMYDQDDNSADESEISLTSKPRILYVSHEKSPIIKPLGATFMLQCVTTGNPKPEIMWYKDGSPLSNHFRIGRWALKFTKTITTDTGNYTCIASNPLGKANNSFLVEIGEIGRKVSRGKPLITGSNITVEEGQRAIMECGVESSTLPHIEWLKQVDTEKKGPDQGEQHAITMEGEYFNVLTKPFLVDYVLKEGVYYHKLMIENAQPEDAGKYVCLGANTYGYDYQFNYLEVISKNHGYHSSISFPILVTVIVVAVAVLGCIFTLLFYCRPRRDRRSTQHSVEVSMVIKEGFIPMHSGPSSAVKCPTKSSNNRPTQPVTYIAGISNSILR